MRRFFLFITFVGVIGMYLVYVRGWDSNRLREETARQIPIPAVQQLISASTTPIGTRGAGTHWEEATGPDTARAEAGIANVNGRLLLFGGIDGYGRTLDSMEIYDSASDTWSRGKLMLQAVHHPGVAVTDQDVIVAGGLVGINSQPIDQSWAYSIVNREWREVARLGDFRGAAAAVSLGNRIYLIGGQTNAGPSNSMEIYDPARNLWTDGPSMPTARTNLTAFVLGGKIFAVGGTKGGVSGNLDIVEVFNPETNKWKLAAPMQVKRSDFASTVVGDTAYVMGGEASDGTIDSIETYDAKKNAWKTFTLPLPAPRHGLKATTVGNRIYTIGGGRRTGFSVSSLNEVLLIATPTTQKKK